MKSTRPWVGPWVAGAAAILVALAGGVWIGAARSDEGARIARLEAESAGLRGRTARLEAERDRLRIERNALEARLAAGRPRGICPQDSVSTASAELLPFFEVDYPCGWHVLYDARSAISAEDERRGLHVEVVLFSRLPISLRPRQEPVADIELADWSDDTSDEEDALPAFAQWIEEERAAFESLAREDRFEVGEGVTVQRLVGTQRIFDEPVEVHVMLWEFEDPFNGQRHVLRAFSLAPSTVVARALERMARSFQILRR